MNPSFHVSLQSWILQIPETLLFFIPPFLCPSFSLSLLFFVPSFLCPSFFSSLHPFLPSSFQSCTPVLSCPVTIFSCIPPVLHPTHPASLLSCLSIFLRPSFHIFFFPASLLSFILLSCIPPFIYSPFLHPSFPIFSFHASLQSWIHPVLHTTCMYCIPPFLHTSCPVFLLSSISPVLNLLIIPHFLCTSSPESLQSRIPHFLIASSPVSLLSPSYLHPSFPCISLFLPCITPVLNSSCLASFLSCIPPVLHPFWLAYNTYCTFI